jgi:mannonate dehydratase
MHRRDFLAAPLLVAPLRATEQSASKSRRALMKVGTQHGDSDAILRVLAGFGVNHICSRLPSVRLDDKWSVESLSRFREHVESFGITLDMMPLPMSSTTSAASSCRTSCSARARIGIARSTTSVR